MADVDALPEFSRDDRKITTSVTSGLMDVLGIAESIFIQERFGLSVVFDEQKLEWTATDPRKRYAGTGNTPTAAILFWDITREEDQGDADDASSS